MPIFFPKEKTLSINDIEILEEEAKKESIAQKNIKPSKNQLQILKKDNRFYLPVLKINHPEYWESKPKSERKHLTDELAKETCLSNCCGVPGLKAGCCQLDPDDLEHILGPVDEEWIKRTVKWLTTKTGHKHTRHDLVIDFEEGKLIGEKFFNGHQVFMTKESYPMLRIQINGIRFSCKFLNVENGMCNIYLQRPDMCRNYACQFMKSNFLFRDKNHPSIWFIPEK